MLQCIVNVTQNVIKPSGFFSGLLNVEELLLLCINDLSYIMYLKQFFIFSVIGKHREKSNRKLKNVAHPCYQLDRQLLFLFRICLKSASLMIWVEGDLFLLSQELLRGRKQFRTVSDVELTSRGIGNHAA